MQTLSLYICDTWSETMVALSCARNQCNVLYFRILTLFHLSKSLVTTPSDCSGTMQAYSAGCLELLLLHQLAKAPKVS